MPQIRKATEEATSIHHTMEAHATASSLWCCRILLVAWQRRKGGERIPRCANPEQIGRRDERSAA
jgi:hypothetical protein